MNHPAVKVGPDMGAVASDMRKAAFEQKLAPELAGVDAMVRDLVEGATKEAIQNIRLRGLIERARILHNGQYGFSAETVATLTAELLNSADARDAMGEN